MIKLQHIAAAEWQGGLRYRLRFDDGAVGTADLAPELGDDPGVLAVIRAKPDAFAIAPRGRALVWTDAEGGEVDIDAETLRGLCEARQAAAE